MTFIISRARILNEIPIRLAADKLEQVGLALATAQSHRPSKISLGGDIPLHGIARGALRIPWTNRHRIVQTPDTEVAP